MLRHTQMLSFIWPGGPVETNTHTVLVEICYSPILIHICQKLYTFFDWLCNHTRLSVFVPQITILLVPLIYNNLVLNQEQPMNTLVRAFAQLHTVYFVQFRLNHNMIFSTFLDLNENRTIFNWSNDVKYIIVSL